MSVVKNKNGRGILLAMVHAIQQNKQLLGDVDGLIGDGIHIHQFFQLLIQLHNSHRSSHHVQ